MLVPVELHISVSVKSWQLQVLCRVRTPSPHWEEQSDQLDQSVQSFQIIKIEIMRMVVCKGPIQVLPWQKQESSLQVATCTGSSGRGTTKVSPGTGGLQVRVLTPGPHDEEQGEKLSQTQWQR